MGIGAADGSDKHLFENERHHEKGSNFSITICLLFARQKNQDVKTGNGDITTNKMEPFVVRKSVRVKAEPAQVWDALTNPEKTKKYFFNCEVFSDWKVGSPITWKGKVMIVKKIELHGEIVDIQPGKLLKYTLKNESEDDPSNFSTVTDKLSYENGETVLSITDDVGQAEGAEERYKKSVKGWEKVLKGLKEVVEEKKN